MALWRPSFLNAARDDTLCHAEVASTYGDRYIRTFNVEHFLPGHTGCVNSIEFNDDGTLLITGSDDLHFCLYGTVDWKLRVRSNTCHSANLFSCVFVPGSGSTKVVSCGLDGLTSLTDIETAQFRRLHHIRGDIASRIVFSEFSPFVPYIAHGDGAITTLDIRSPMSTTKRMWIDSDVTACNALCVSPRNSFVFAVGTNTGSVYLFDARRLRECSVSSDQSRDECISPCSFLTLMNPLFRHSFGMLSFSRFGAHDGIGGLNFSSDGTALVASYKNNDVFVFELPDVMRYSSRMQWKSEGDTTLQRYPREDRLGQEVPARTSVYKGRQNRQTMFKEAVFFHEDRYIVTGGDDGRLYFWNRISGEVVHKIRADGDIVNGVLVHPSMPVLVACGIDSSAKVLRCRGNLDEPATDRREMQPSSFPFLHGIELAVSDTLPSGHEESGAPGGVGESHEDDSSDETSESDDVLPGIHRLNFLRQVMIAFSSRRPMTLGNLRSLSDQLNSLFRAHVTGELDDESDDDESEPDEESEEGEETGSEEATATAEGAQTAANISLFFPDLLGEEEAPATSQSVASAPPQTEQQTGTAQQQEGAGSQLSSLSSHDEPVPSLGDDNGRTEEEEDDDDEEDEEGPEGLEGASQRPTVYSMLRTLQPYFEEMGKAFTICVRRGLLTNNWATFPFGVAAPQRRGRGMAAARHQLLRLGFLCSICQSALHDVVCDEGPALVEKLFRLGQYAAIQVGIAMARGNASLAVKQAQLLLPLAALPDSPLALASRELRTEVMKLRVKSIGLRVRILRCSAESPLFLQSSMEELRTLLESPELLELLESDPDEPAEEAVAASSSQPTSAESMDPAAAIPEESGVKEAQPPPRLKRRSLQDIVAAAQQLLGLLPPEPTRKSSEQ